MRHGWGLVLLCLFAALAHGATDPVAMGRDWLLQQARDDRAFHNTTTLATPAQASAEVLMLGDPAMASSRTFLQQTPFHGTEYLARRLLGGAGDGAWLLGELWARQNPDGGFGDLPGYQSSVLDTAHALRALAASAATAPAALDYLARVEVDDGGWADGPNPPSVFTTALVLEGLQGFRAEPAVAGMIQRGRAFLQASLADLQEPGLLALTLRALLPGEDGGGLDEALARLRSFQDLDGGWGGDVHTTALALQVLTLAALDIPNPDLGVVRGRVVGAASGWALTGAALQLDGPVTRSVSSDAEGTYQLNALPAGSYRLTVSADQYQTTVLSVAVQPGAVLELGDLLLARIEDATDITVAGTVRDTEGTPLDGVTLSLNQRQAFSDANGRYRLQGLEPGETMISAALTGYYTVDTRLDLRPGDHLVFSPVLIQEGETPPVGSSRLLGRVVDAASNQPLPGVTVSVAGAAPVFSDAAGEFSLDLGGEADVAAAVVLEFGLAGYRARRLGVVAMLNQSLTLGEIRLRPEGPLLADLQIASLDRATVSSDPADLSLAGELKVEVVNHGALASGDFQLRVFADTDGDGQQDDHEASLGSTTVAGLETLARVTVAVPLDGAAAYRDPPLAVVVDSAGQVPESREDNNLATTLAQCHTGSGLPVTLEPVEKWQWRGGGVTTTPMVAPIRDTDGDGRVDAVDGVAVLVISHDGEPDNRRGLLRALDGATGTELWTLHEAYLNAPSQLAVGDLDGDGFPEIVGHRYPRGTVVVSGEGEMLWQSDYPDYTVSLNYGGYSLADLDGDGRGEVLHTRLALNADGSLRWQGAGSLRGVGLNAVADLDLDGIPEVVVGPSVYGADGELLWERLDLPDGKVAVADLDDDPALEIVLTGRSGGMGMSYLLDPDGTLLWGPVPISARAVGPATIGDVDGDGVAEIGIAGEEVYTLLNADGSPRWSAPTMDYSAQTAATFFDLDGDGVQEVIYGDSRSFWVLDGETGEVRLHLDNHAYTAFESPTVADVDNDGHAEVVVVSSNLTAPAVRVLENLHDDWMPTRPIRNQYAYHPGAVGDAGELPDIAGQGWDRFNAFRSNPVLSEAPAADPSVGQLVLLERPGEAPALRVRVANGGSLASGLLRVAFSQILAGDPQPLGQITLNLDPLEYRDATLEEVALRGQGMLLAELHTTDGVVDCRAANNRVEAPVTAAATGQLSLLGDATVAPGAALTVSARLINTGSLSQHLHLLWWVEDAAGQRVAELPGVAPVVLQGGAEHTLEQRWWPGDLLAGDYRIVASLRDHQDRELDRQSLVVTVQADSTPPHLRLLTGRPDYRAGESVAVQILLHNPAQNRLLPAGELVVSVVDAAQRAIVQTRREVPALAPGQYRRVDLAFDLPASALPGEYRVTVTWPDQEPPLLADTVFSVFNDPATAPVGHVVAERTSLTAGEAQSCRFSVQAHPSAPRELRSGLVSLSSGVDHAWERRTVDSGQGDTAWQRTLDTTGLAPGDWACVLEIAEGDEWRGLAHAVFGLLAADDGGTDDGGTDGGADDDGTDDPTIPTPVPVPTLRGGALLLLGLLITLIGRSALPRNRATPGSHL